jgi:hypothetical protein
MWFPIISLFFFQCRVCGSPSSPSSSSIAVMNPVPTLEEEKGDYREQHTLSNESSSYTGRRRGR